MTIVKYKDGENEIYNTVGRQVHGSKAAGLDGLNPKELLEASLGLCVSLTLTSLLERDGVPLGEEGLNIEVVSTKAADGSNRFSDFSVSVNLPDMTPEYKEKAITIVERGCTIGNTIRFGANTHLIDSNEK